MIRFLKALLLRRPRPTPASTPVDSSLLPTSCLCVVANIRDEVPWGPGGKQRRVGHPRFAPGTKVYVLAPSWDWITHQTFECVARRRVSKRWVRQTIAAKFLTNWRVQRAYAPALIKRVSHNRLNAPWTEPVARTVVAHQSSQAAIDR